MSVGCPGSSVCLSITCNARLTDGALAGRTFLGCFLGQQAEVRLLLLERLTLPRCRLQIWESGLRRLMLNAWMLNAMLLA